MQSTELRILDTTQLTCACGGKDSAGAVKVGKGLYATPGTILFGKNSEMLIVGKHDIHPFK